jgi:hypothetical protein
MTVDEISEKIDNYANTYAILLETSKSLGIQLDSSPLYNFRDALAHYCIFYDATDPNIRLSQETSIVEHLNRGLKDGYYFILLNLKIGIHCEIKKVQQNSPEKARNLRRLLHRYKSLELQLRRQAIVSDLTVIITYINDLTPLLLETKKLFQKYRMKWNFNCI